MKFLKVIVIALITVFAFNEANAQMNVKVGNNPRKHRKVVVVENRKTHKPHHYHKRVVVKHRSIRH